jgi:transposase-like protein
MKEVGMGDVDTRVELVRALIPLGLKAVGELLQEEVEWLAGERYARGKETRRWGSQGGSVYLMDQKVPISIPRLRNKREDREVGLETYRKFQTPQAADEQVFLKLLNGLSTHRYEESARLAPEVFGISASSVSRRFRRWSAAHLQRLMMRRLEGYDVVAVFIDGKAFAKDGLVIALGVMLSGEKAVLGMEQMNAENSRSVGQFLDKLIARGLRYEEGLLVIVDGSRGIIKAVREKFCEYALVQRCQQHKKENVVSYLPLGQQKAWRIRLGQAYHADSYEEAAGMLRQLHRELSVANPSAAASLEEGLEETLTILRLDIPGLRRSFQSTNCIESLLSQLGQYTDKVDRWRNGRHIQEWAASGLLRLEPRLRKIMGWRHLPLLRERLRERLHLHQQTQTVVEEEPQQELVAISA